jgi:hypothetical protein
MNKEEEGRRLKETMMKREKRRKKERTRWQEREQGEVAGLI